jgi:hypothetical protein
MGIPTSSIPAARAYLLAQIEATVTQDPTDATAELLVSLDEPGTHQPADVVIVGDVHQTYQPYASVGSGRAYWLEESYSVEITISVFRSGDDGTNALAQTVFTRARMIADQIVNVVRSDPSLGGAVQRARPGTVTHQSTWSTGDVTGRVTEIQIPVECINVL